MKLLSPTDHKEMIEKERIEELSKLQDIEKETAKKLKELNTLKNEFDETKRILNDEIDSIQRQMIAKKKELSMLQ